MGPTQSKTNSSNSERRRSVDAQRRPSLEEIVARARSNVSENSSSDSHNSSDNAMRKGSWTAAIAEGVNRARRYSWGPVRVESGATSFSGNYRIKKKIGDGQFSTVYRVVHIHEQQFYAAKEIQKKKIDEVFAQRTREEVMILSEMRHPNIVRLYGVFVEEEYLYVVTELMRGKDLFDRIEKKGRLNETEARAVISDLLKAVKYMHSKGIIHRDLKPENLLFETTDEESRLKVIDFGFATRVDSTTSTMCGTHEYLAPEVIKRERLGTGVDMWSVGVIMYILLCGYQPFHEKTREELYRKIKRAEFKFREEDWNNVSDEAKDLIRKMLQRAPAQRITSTDALEHRWFRRGLNGVEPRRKLKAVIRAIIAMARIRRARSMTVRLRWKKAVRAVMAKERDKKRLDRLSRFQLMTAPPTTMRQGRDVRRVSYVVTAARARDMDIIDDDLSRKVEDTVQYIDALSNQQFDDELPEVHFNEAAREGYSDQRLDSVIEQFMKAEGYSEELREMLKPDP